MNQRRRLEELDEATRHALLQAEAERIAAEVGLSADEIVREAERLLTRFAEEHPGEPFDWERFDAWADAYLRWTYDDA